MTAALPRPCPTQWLLMCAVSLGLALTACSSGPRVPDWALEAYSAQQRANEAHLSGDSRVAQVEASRARRELARTGRIDLVARAELSSCAVRFASLEMLVDTTGAAAPSSAGCVAFEALRRDAPEPEQAYADYLLGRLSDSRIALLPATQQAAAAAGNDGPRRLAAIRAIEDPLSRLVAAAAALRDGVAPPGLAALAVETASTQGWRRPLLAWLGLQRQRALAAGDVEAARALETRIVLVSSSGVAAGR